MTNGVLSLGDVQASSNDTSSTDAETTSDDSDELRDVCEAIGADYDHASAYVNEHGKRSDLVEFARRLANDAELWAVQAEYRQGNSINRIIRKFLRNEDADFTAYTGAFYGDSDDPAEGTYNFVQQRSHEMDGNLMFYQALFPTPVAEYWDSDPVLWHEFDEIGYADGMQDSHIYVTEEFVNEYSGVNSITVDGESRPVPPSNDMLGDSSGNAGSDSPEILAFDPGEFHIPDLEDELGETEYSVEQLENVLQLEKSGQSRKGAKNAIRNAIDAAEQEADSDDSDGSETSGAQAAGEITGEPGNDVDPEKVIELMDNGWSKDEIQEFFA